MSEFGKLLRHFRESGRDPLFPEKKLSQIRLGELVGQELGAHRYSGAAVSDWERGESKIHADDRSVLVSLIKVLYQCGGLRTLAEANELLASGNYRGLNSDEVKKVFRETTSDIPPQAQSASTEERERRQRFMDMVGIFSSEALQAFQAILAEAKEGPSPSWPRLLAALMRRISDRWSLSISSILWVGVWFLAWWLITPSLRWPFPDRYSAFSATVLYMAGTLIIPLLIGLLINTKDNEYWKQQSLADAALIRLYTYQGAGIGFNLGYFFVFPLVLVRYYLHLSSSVWVEVAAVTLGLILGNMSARVVPHNLWVAYGRLRLSDGAIFFVIALVGPLWGLFFLEFHSVFLTPVLGLSVILIVLILVVIMAKRQWQKGS